MNIVIVNFSKSSGVEKLKSKVDAVYKNLRKSESDLIISSSSVDNFIFSPNRSPLSIHPYSSEDIANILLGRYVVWYFFNVSALFREIEQHGWKVSNVIYDRKDKESDKSMFTVNKNRLNIKIPPTSISRLIYEGMSINSLIKLFDNHAKFGLIGSDYGVMPEYEKESELWD